MGMAFRLEPLWPLGDDRWTALALACLISAIMTYFLPDELKWVTRVQESSAWKLFWFSAAVFLRAKGSQEKLDRESTLGGEAGGLNDPKIEKRYERQLRRDLGLEDLK